MIGLVVEIYEWGYPPTWNVEIMPWEISNTYQTPGRNILPNMILLSWHFKLS